jgi:hypothetical protein
MFVQFCHNGESDSNIDAGRLHSRAGHAQTSRILPPWQCAFRLLVLYLG